MDADGSHTKQLTDGPMDDRVPSFSQDGKRLAFCRGEAGISNIWTMHADGTNKEKLTHGPWFDGLPVFSADGQQLAFNRQEEIRPFSANESVRFPMRMPEIFVIPRTERACASNAKFGQ